MTEKPKVVVVGSANTDFVVRVAQIPITGETVLGGGFFTARGGKGANQAVAAARLGAEVAFVARLGQDDLGSASIEAYRSEGIDVTHVALDEQEPSGVALILVSETGENIIAVAPGANSRLSPQDVAAAEAAIQSAGCLLLQLEIPLDTARAAVELAHKHGVRVILNPAPAADLPHDMLSNVDVLTPNEREALGLAGLSGLQEPATLARLLLERSGSSSVVITRGAEGALVARAGDIRAVRSFQITPVDTTGAGDAFNGALAVKLAEGAELVEAVRFASAAGAISATRPGAQPSLPTRSELEDFLAASEAG
jgi:ribokinase